MFACGTVVWLISFFCILMFQRSFYTSFHFLHFEWRTCWHGDFERAKRKGSKISFCTPLDVPPADGLAPKKRSEPWEFLEALRGHFFVRQIWRLFEKNCLTEKMRIHPPKTNMDIQNDGLETVDSFKMLPFLVSMLDFWCVKIIKITQELNLLE